MHTPQQVELPERTAAFAPEIQVTVTTEPGRPAATQVSPQHSGAERRVQEQGVAPASRQPGYGLALLPPVGHEQPGIRVRDAIRVVYYGELIFGMSDGLHGWLLAGYCAFGPAKRQ